MPYCITSTFIFITLNIFWCFLFLLFIFTPVTFSVQDFNMYLWVFVHSVILCFLCVWCQSNVKSPVKRRSGIFPRLLSVDSQTEKHNQRRWVFVQRSDAVGHTTHFVLHAVNVSVSSVSRGASTASSRHRSCRPIPALQRRDNGTGERVMMFVLLFLFPITCRQNHMSS